MVRPSVAILRLMSHDWMPRCSLRHTQSSRRSAILSWPPRGVVSCRVGLRVAPKRVRRRHASVEIITRILKVASRLLICTGSVKMQFKSNLASPICMCFCGPRRQPVEIAYASLYVPASQARWLCLLAARFHCRAIKITIFRYIQTACTITCQSSTVELLETRDALGRRSRWSAADFGPGIQNYVKLG